MAGRFPIKLLFPALTKPKKFSNTRPLSERISIAQNAINSILPQLNSATGEFNGKSPNHEVIGPLTGPI